MFFSTRHLISRAINSHMTLTAITWHWATAARALETQPHVNMATTQQPEVVQDRRTKALEEYRKKLVEHRELDANLKKRKFLRSEKIWNFHKFTSEEKVWYTARDFSYWTIWMWDRNSIGLLYFIFSAWESSRVEQRVRPQWRWFEGSSERSGADSRRGSQTTHWRQV